MATPMPPAPDTIRVLLAGPDTLYFSCDLGVSDAMRERLEAEKAEAQALKKIAHCPQRLGARICPQGAKGGYAFLIETPDFSVKITEIYLEDFKSRQARTQHTQFSPIGRMRIRQRGHGRHTYQRGPTSGGVKPRNKPPHDDREGDPAGRHHGPDRLIPAGYCCETLSKCLLRAVTWPIFGAFERME